MTMLIFCNWRTEKVRTVTISCTKLKNGDGRDPAAVALCVSFCERHTRLDHQPDAILFDSRIHWSSYLLSVAVTVLFAFVVKLIMRIKLKRIHMAESLKSVE